MSFAIRATGGRVILIHVAKQNGYESCLLFSPNERSVKSVSKENVRGMQDDVISREQAIKATWQDTGYTDPFNVMTAIRDRIQQLPPIQPKRGRWIRTGSGSLYDHYECSECGKAPKWECMGDNRWKIAFTDFCPNCGADMREVNNEI